jgi:hypothetical protein
MRRVFCLLFAAALVLVSAQAVLAAKPDRVPLELPPSLELAAGEACEFPLLVEFLANRGKTLTFHDNEGNAIRQIGTGTLKIRVTNLADESVAPLELNISGPIHITLHPDGSATLVFGGRGISLFPPGTFVLTAGRSVVELDAEGEVISVTNMGIEEDLCVALAG